MTMDQDRWRQVDRILDQVLDLAPADRGPFLDRACAGDPSLRAAVKALLEADEWAGTSFLETPLILEEQPGTPTARGVGPTAGTGAGERIGPYQVVRELGHGGMGTVYLAERADEQFEQTVAVKVIRRGMDSEDIVRRFLHERQILARLQHPHIARLLDGGVTASGQPWFALEFVDGVPLTRYCDEGRLGFDARLALFRAVGEAVVYAHRNLVVHRDLKPGNILVTAEGEVKLLDFGIAKLLEQRSGEDDLTRPGSSLLTPEYAAPEQVLGRPITTATDVYALGCVLYELLTGHRAHRFVDHSPRELVRVVSEVESPPPSTAVLRTDHLRHADGSETTVSPESVGRARRLVPAQLRRRLRGELDAIVLQALRKEPEHRYSSVEALLEDLRRHAAGLPVRARRSTPVYRLGKFAKRNWLPVAAVSLLVLSLSGGLFGTTRQKRVAEREGARAREVTEFITGIFQASDPVQARGREITARELLDAGTERVDTELAGQPALQAELLTLLGSIYRDLAVIDRADSLLRRAITLREQVHGREHVLVAGSLNQLGGLLLETGQYQEAYAVFHRALAIRERAFGPYHPDVSTSVNNLGIAANWLGKAEESESLYRRAVALDRRNFGPGSVERAEGLSNLGRALKRRGAFDEADSAFQTALTLRRAGLPADDPRIGLALLNLASLRHDQTRYDDAEQLYREGLASLKAVHGNRHPDVAMALSALGLLLDDLGRLGEAVELYREAGTIRRETLGDDHNESLAALSNLAVTWYRMGELDSAARIMRAVMSGWHRLLGEEHPRVATATNNLGAVLVQLGQLAEAEPLLRRALAWRRDNRGPRHPEVAQSLRNLGTLLGRTGRAAEAEASFREALDICREAYAEPHPRTAEVLVSYGEFLTGRGQAGTAEPLLREGVAIRAEKVGAQSPAAAEAGRALGLALVHLGRYAEAESILLDSHRLFQDQPYQIHQLRATARALVTLYQRWGRPEMAAEYR